jgi:hypothetical protein
MKYTITINQYAIFKAGLIFKTDVVDWIIVDYLKDFALYKKAKKIIYQNEEYIWLNYNHLIVSLPLLHIKTKASVSYRIGKLKKLGLIKTCRSQDNTLYYTFTDQLIDIVFSRPADIERARKSNRVCHSDPKRCAGEESLARLKRDPSLTTFIQDDNNTSNLTDPVRTTITGGVRTGITAQYKTKISIINKDKNNNKDISFSSSFLKTDRKNSHRDSEHTAQRTLIGNKPKTKNNTRCTPCLSGKSGFKSMSGIWNVISRIKERQYTNKNIRMNSRINSDYIRDPRGHYE